MPAAASRCRGADLLRPAGLQFRRPRRREGHRERRDRGLRRLRLRRRAVRLLRRHDEEALSGAFRGRGEMAPRADSLAAKTYELVSFLVDVLGVTSVAARIEGSVTYHDSCSGLRELGINAQPRRLLASVERADAEGAAGAPTSAAASAALSASNIPDISNAIVEEKTDGDRGDRRRDASCRRPRLPDEHGRQAEARGARDEVAPRCRSARRHDRRAGDRRG